MLLNNEQSLIAMGGSINIPIISREDFARMFREICEEYYFVQNPNDFEQKLLTNTGSIDINEEVFENIKNVNEIGLDYGYIYALPDEVPGNDIVNIIGLRQTSKGIPYLGCIVVGDSNIEVFRTVFFDGNNFQMYTPHYGNCWNINGPWAIGFEGGDENEDEDYCNNYGVDLDTVLNASRIDLIDENAILMELETVFIPGTQIQNPVLNLNNTGTSNTSNNSTPSSASKTTAMGIFYSVFEKKMVQMIPAIQQSLTVQGITTYNKDDCFKNLKDKNVFQKDIYNYILQFNNFDSTANKIIECTKIAMYIKRFMYYHEGLVL